MTLMEADVGRGVDRIEAIFFSNAALRAA